MPLGHSKIYGVASRQLGLLVLLIVLLGCGVPDGPPRVAVEGEVSLNGKPIENGSILFIPAEGTQGPQAGRKIQNGYYQLSRSEGPVIGMLRVEIRADQELAYDPTEPEESVLHIGESLPPNPVPPIYNERSTLLVETTAEGENRFDFRLRAGP